MDEPDDELEAYTVLDNFKAAMANKCAVSVTVLWGYEAANFTLTVKGAVSSIVSVKPDPMAVWASSLTLNSSSVDPSRRLAATHARCKHQTSDPLRVRR